MFSSIDRQAGNSHPLASSGLSSLLALEEPWPRTGSLEESRYYLILAHYLGYGGPQEGRMNLLDEVSRLLNAYTKAILASDS